MLDEILTKIDQQHYLTDSGLETTLVFHDGLELPFFAAFTLLDSAEGRQRLRRYYRTHLELAKKKGAGFILDTPTWRANPDWAERMNMPMEELQHFNHLAVSELKQIAQASPHTPTLISGCVGPRGDGYQPEFMMSIREAQNYHRTQVRWLAQAGAQMISAMTLCYPEEAIGITLAAQEHNIPSVISFTVETDGKLVCGMSLKDAINQVDEATGYDENHPGQNGPLYYMVNCAHPTHFENELEGEQWLTRIRGVRANASTKSHAELDESVELDSGDPQALGKSYQQLQQRLPRLAVFGGCCGTDHRHIEAISHACL